MILFLARKLLRALFTLLFVVSFAFVVLRVATDPVEAMLAGDLSDQAIEIYRQRWGLDQPLWDQYVRYIAGLTRGDFGVSYRDGRPALDLVLERVPMTLQLSLSGFALTLVIGLALGTIAAIRHNGLVDRFVMSAAVVGYCLPSFVLGLILMYVFAVELGWLPSSGSSTPAHMVLPVATYALVGSAALARFTRSALLDVLGQPYITGARAFGIPFREVLLRYALPNAAIPLVTILGFSVAGLIGGAILIETVFAWPGMGRALVTAVTTRDLSTVQAIVILFAAVMVITNFTVDLLYGLLDPRIAGDRR